MQRGDCPLCGANVALRPLTGALRLHRELPMRERLCRASGMTDGEAQEYKFIGNRLKESG